MLIAAQSSESWFSNSPKWPETHSATLLSRYQAKVCSSFHCQSLSNHSRCHHTRATQPVRRFLDNKSFCALEQPLLDTVTGLHGDTWWLTPNSKSPLHLSSPTWTQCKCHLIFCLIRVLALLNREARLHCQPTWLPLSHLCHLIQPIGLALNLEEQTQDCLSLWI